MCLWLCTASVHNTAQNSSDNLPSYLEANIIAQMPRRLSLSPCVIMLITQMCHQCIIIHQTQQSSQRVHCPTLRTGNRKGPVTHTSFGTFDTTGFVQKSDCGSPDFSRTKLLLFPHFSRHFLHLMWIKPLQNCLLNAEISHTMYSSILNIEWNSNFGTLNIRCYVMNCKKINKCMGN